MTDNLLHRIAQHRQGSFDGFTRKYKVNRLMYYEVLHSPQEAALREKQIKKCRREKKIVLFIPTNPQRKDLTAEVWKPWAV